MIDADDIGAEVGQQHRAVRSRPDACEFNDPHTREGPICKMHHLLSE
jgi:hypothetical protein